MFYRTFFHLKAFVNLFNPFPIYHMTYMLTTFFKSERKAEFIAWYAIEPSNIIYLWPMTESWIDVL